GFASGSRSSRVLSHSTRVRPCPRFPRASASRKWSASVFASSSLYPSPCRVSSTSSRLLMGSPDLLPHKTFTRSTRSLHAGAGSCPAEPAKGGTIGMRRKTHLFWLAAVGLFVLVGVAAATQPPPPATDRFAGLSAHPGPPPSA